eukprot:60190_1
MATVDSTETEFMEHIVLLGDSILDNGRYVTGPAVIDQLTKQGNALNWKSTNCAVDGARTIDLIQHYIETIPDDATVIVLSIGGNDGLKSLGKVAYGVASIWMPWNLYALFMETKNQFMKRYTEAIQKIRSKCPNAKIIACSVYYPVFPRSIIIQSIANIGVNLLSGVIIQTALQYGNIPVIDIRHVFDKQQDYANTIEPGVPGGDKIINNVVHIIRNHNFNQRYTMEKDIIYKDTSYSHGMDPSDYVSKYWKQRHASQPQGSSATIFFRRAFNERENSNIKFYFKCCVGSAISLLIGYTTYVSFSKINFSFRS